MTAGWITAIVPTIGRPESLALLLRSLALQSRRPDEIVVADASVGDAVACVIARPLWASQGLNVRRIPVRPPNAVTD